MANISQSYVSISSGEASVTLSTTLYHFEIRFPFGIPYKRLHGVQKLVNGQTEFTLWLLKRVAQVLDIGLGYFGLSSGLLDFFLPSLS